MNPYNKLMDSFARTRVGAWLFLHLVSPLHQRLMPWTKGQLNSCVGTQFYHHLVLLRCIGAKSGKPRGVPLLATPLGDQIVLAASAAGHEKNPGWYNNLKANPECTLLIRGRGEIPFVAHEAEGEERERAWEAANTLYSDSSLTIRVASSAGSQSWFSRLSPKIDPALGGVYALGNGLANSASTMYKFRKICHLEY